VRILVTGAGGTIGGRLAALLSARHEVTGIVRRAAAPPGLSTFLVDLSGPAVVERLLATTGPDAVLHCAAFSNADACQADPAMARLLNVELPARLARACRQRGARLVSISTDLVLDGSRALSTEATPLGPTTLVYGLTKREGERVVLEESPIHAVLRIPLMIGRGHGERGTASEAALWALRAGRRLRLFTDQHRSPTDAESLAELVERLLQGAVGGLFNAGGPERLSRYELGVRVARIFGLDERTIEPATSAEQPLPRPRDTSLDSSRAARELGWRPRPLEAGLRESRLRPGAAATWAASP